MADSKYQPVPRHDTLDSLSQSNSTLQHQTQHNLDPADVSDLSSHDTDDENDMMDLDEEGGGDETVMAPLNRRASRSSGSSKKRQKLSSRRSLTKSKFRGWLSLLTKSIVRHRLALVAAAGLIFIFLPLIAYQRSIRNFFWADQVYVRPLYFLSTKNIVTLTEVGISAVVSVAEGRDVGDVGA